MKKKLLLILLSMLMVNGIFTQKILTGLQANKEVLGAKLIRYTPRSIYPNHVVFANPTATVKDLGMWIKTQLKLPKDYSLQLIKQETDNQGYLHQNYQQNYKGIPVEYGVYKAHYKGTQLASINGDIYQVANLNTTPSISANQAIVYAKDYVHATRYKWLSGKKYASHYFPTSQLMVLVHQGQSYLVYKVDIYSIEPLSRKYIYVNAHNGTIVTEIERLHDIDVPGTANTAYSGMRNITIDSNGVDYTLTESGRNLETINSSTTLTYHNPTANWNLTGLDQYALDAHWASEMTYDYYLNTFGRDGVNGAHYLLTSYVNEGPGFGNAYWDGSTIHYGDGDGSLFLTPLTTVGIVGHETTHGVTQFSAGLVYAGESGAMNESFSDIFGLCIDKYARNINLSVPASWLVGAECTGGAGFRDMSNPNFFGNADTYGGAYWNAGDIVHYNSGVQNFWFYLLTIGGSGTNDNSNVYNVTGIGITDAQSIAYRNLVYYLTPSSNFADSRYYSLIAAEDLFGACSPQVQSTANAWYAVGVGGPYQNVTTSSFTFGNPVSCLAPISVNFTNLSFNATSYLWNFGDGDTSTQQNPAHAYAAPGTYSVQLIASGCGINVADTFQTNITITTASPILSVTPSQNQNITCCSGTLYDSGGSMGNYTDGEFCTANITVPLGNIVNINFTNFSTEFGFDYVYIYDGPNATYPLIGSYTGYSLPNFGATIYSTTNQIYVEFTSDGSVNSTGFEFNWFCTPPAPPISSFQTSMNTVCIGSTIAYYNTSTYGDSIIWDFQGGTPGTSNADTVIVNYNTLGTYTTILTAVNILGTDSSTTSIQVVALPTPTATLVGNVISTTTTYAAYQWYVNGTIIPGATSQSYTLTQGGNYTCMVTDNNGCTGTTAGIISTLGVNTEAGNLIALYPNPSSQFIIINNPLLIDNGYSVEIMNMLGEVIYNTQQYTSPITIPLDMVKSGSYLVRIAQNGICTTRKIVVIK